jgi:hypothetical protein
MSHNKLMERKLTKAKQKLVKAKQEMTKVSKSKARNDKSFQVTTMSVLSAHGAQAVYLSVLCNAVVLTL